MLLVVTDVYYDHGLSVVLTSGRDGVHKPDSLHPKGRAVDFRRYAGADMDAICHMIASRLGPDFQVILEPDHVHIEFDPREK
jgi:hypothetical protein